MSNDAKKVFFPVSVADPLNANRLSSGSGLSAYVLRAGGDVLGAPTIAVGTTTATYRLANRGDLTAGDRVWILNYDSGTDVYTVVADLVGTVQADPAADVLNAEWDVSIEWENTSGSSVLVGDKDRVVVRYFDTSARIPLFTDASLSITQTNPSVLGDDGVLDFFCARTYDEFDLYLSGSGITDGYYAADIPVLDVGIDSFLLAAETLTTGSALAPNTETSWLILSGSGAIDTISDSFQGRLLVLLPDSGVTLNAVTTPTAKDQIVSDTAGSIALTAGRAIWLLGRSLGGFNVWEPFYGSEAPSLDALTDVNEASPATSDLLMYDGAEWIGTKSVGTATNPITSLTVGVAGLRLQELGGTDLATISVAALAASRVITIPDPGTSLSYFLLTEGAATISNGVKSFASDAFALIDTTSFFGIDFDVSALTANRTVTVTDTGVLTVGGTLGVDLADLSDFVDYAGKGTNTPVVWDGTQYTASFAVGSSGGNGVLSGYFHASTGVRIANNAPLYTTFTSLLGGVVGSDISVTLPAVTAKLLSDAESNQTVTGDISFDDDALLIRDVTDITKKARFDCGQVSTASTRVISIPDYDLDLTQAERRIVSYAVDLFQPSDGFTGWLVNPGWSTVGDFVVIGRVPTGKVWVPIRASAYLYLGSSTIDYDLQVGEAASIFAALGSSVLSSDLAMAGTGPNIITQNSDAFSLSSIAANQYVLWRINTVTTSPTWGSGQQGTTMQLLFEYGERTV